MKIYKAGVYIHDVSDLVVGQKYSLAGIVGVFIGIRDETVYQFLNEDDGIGFWIEEYSLQDYMDNKKVCIITGVVRPRKKY